MKSKILTLILALLLVLTCKKLQYYDVKSHKLTIIYISMLNCAPYKTTRVRLLIIGNIERL